ncbi:hypothetical protein TIFTF001_027578 [Ficus carica]|uniref:Uncharacterized protein n=1 Tax=Ficus carica TaxID=3494 RepID=A0AA88DPI9_FICCA|nr:hypothetical protein TIFTF001_027578 [Ficus carica]
MLLVGEPPRLAGVTLSATGGVPGSHPMDYMLGLRLLCPIARFWVLSSGWHGSAALPSRIFVLIPPRTVHPDWRWVSEQSMTRHLVEDVLYRSDQRGVLAEPPRWRSRAAIGFGMGFHHGVLPLILPVLTPL